MSPKIWLRHADPSEELDPRLKEAAELEAHRILPFRRDRLGDSTLAIEAIEEVVRSASRAVSSIKHPRWYVLTSSLRRLKRAVRRSPFLCYVPPAHLDVFASADAFEKLDAKIFCEKVRSHLSEADFGFLMSVLTKDCTWKQLGAQMGLSADAARKKYDRLIIELREWLSQTPPPERQ
jgi:hypothetical protein